MPICVLTDYGLDDEFVGVLHRVLVATAPLSPVVDLTHGIVRHDVRAGSLALWRAAPYLAPAVVIAVVDPGVATARRPVAIEVDGGGAALLMVGPDNGLLTPAAHRVGSIRRAVVLDDPSWHLPGRPGTGTTFAGRDIFAPVAARLAAGADLDDCGRSVDPASLLGGPLLPAGVDARGRIASTVLWVDRFGNVQLDVAAADLPLGARARLLLPETASQETVDAVVAGAYADLGHRPGLVPDSTGLVALCLDRGDAASSFGLAAGDRVEVDTTKPGLPGNLSR